MKSFEFLTISVLPKIIITLMSSIITLQNLKNEIKWTYQFLIILADSYNDYEVKESPQNVGSIA